MIFCLGTIKLKNYPTNWKRMDWNVSLRLMRCRDVHRYLRDKISKQLFTENQFPNVFNCTYNSSQAFIWALSFFFLLCYFFPHPPPCTDYSLRILARNCTNPLFFHGVSPFPTPDEFTFEYLRWTDFVLQFRSALFFPSMPRGRYHRGMGHVVIIESHIWIQVYPRKIVHS